MKSARLTRPVAVAAATASLATIGALTAPAAQAATLNVTYDAVGTSHIAKPNSTVAIGPTELKVGLDSAAGTISGHMNIPDTTSEFKVIGFVPVKAKVSFIEAAPVTGRLIREGSTTRVESTASYTVKLSNVKIAGIPGFVGSRCQTKAPVTIPANTPPGEVFNITSGGNLAGSYSLSSFEHCGINTFLINQIVPGGGNTLNLQVSNGRLG